MLIQRIILAMSTRFQFRSSFFKSVGVLVSGTAFAQVLTVIALPLLTRIYTPTDFSVLAVYTSIVSIISVAACLRFEIAIPLPKRDAEAANLLALSLLFCTVISIAVFFGVLLFSAQIIELVGQPALRPYLWLLPLGIWLASSYSAIQFWATRKKKFGIIAKTRMTQAIGGVGTQLGLGWAGLAPLGLLLGQMINSGAGFFGLICDALRGDRALIRSISRFRMRRIFRRYVNFPKYSTLEALSNNAGIQLPLIIIASLAVGPEVGFLALAMRVMAAPMAFIGSSVAQVYLAEASAKYYKGELRAFTIKVMLRLLVIGGPIIAVGGAISPLLFPIIFGPEWGRAGELVFLMVPWFIIQFVVSPVSMSLHITGRQGVALIVQLAGVLFRSGCVVFAYFVIPGWLSEVYIVTGAVFYFFYLLIVLACVGGRAKAMPLARGNA